VVKVVKVVKHGIEREVIGLVGCLERNIDGAAVFGISDWGTDSLEMLLFR